MYTWLILEHSRACGCMTELHFKGLFAGPIEDVWEQLIRCSQACLWCIVRQLPGYPVVLHSPKTLSSAKLYHSQHCFQAKNLSSVSLLAIKIKYCSLISICLRSFSHSPTSGGSIEFREHVILKNCSNLEITLNTIKKYCTQC